MAGSQEPGGKGSEKGKRGGLSGWVPHEHDCASHMAWRQQLNPRVPPAGVDCPRSTSRGRHLSCCPHSPKAGAGTTLVAALTSWRSGSLCGAE